MVSMKKMAMCALASSAPAGVEASSSSVPFSRKSNSCPRGSREAFEVRGGDGIWGRSNSREEREQRLEKSDAILAAEVSDEEYEHEYDYYEADADADADADVEDYAEYENYPEDGDMEDDGVEYEYYEEEEKPTRNFGKVQDINGEFVESSEEEAGGTVEEEETGNNEDTVDEEDAGIGLEEEDAQGGRSWSLWGRRNRFMEEKSEADLNGDVAFKEENASQNSESENSDEAEEGEEDDEEDDDYLFMTPLPSAKVNDSHSPRKLQLAIRTVPTTDMDIEKNDVQYVDGAEYEENEYVEEGVDLSESSDDYLLETPIVKSRRKATFITRKAPHSSKAKAKSSRWWQYRPQISENGQSRKKQWRPNSSTKASFISPPFYPRTLPSFSLRSASGRSIYSEWGSSISAAFTAIIHPIGNAVQTITYSVASTMSKWVSFSLCFIRNTSDFLWHGPVDGVTTTGIASRYSGLSSLSVSSPVVIAMTSIVVLGLMTVLVTRRWRGAAGGDGGRWNFMKEKQTSGPDGYDDDEDDYDKDAVHPPSVEEEMEFLTRKFDPANPSSKDRVTEAIAKENRFNWPARRGDRPKSRGGQRQFTIKSIQTWWKGRPSQSVAIIEPRHLSGREQPSGQDVERLRKRLTASEQEREALRQDVQRLNHKLQRAQKGVRSVVSQNKWLEKQTSQADQILTKAMEVERRKASDELTRVRESMRGVLERERMLMRGRIAGSERRDFGGRNDVDLNKGAPKRILDGVKIVRDSDQADEKTVGSDKTWTAL